MSPRQALAFVEGHGIVLQAARGPVPSLAEAIAGGPIRGSWWGHPKGQEIFRVAEAVSEGASIVRPPNNAASQLIASVRRTKGWGWMASQ